MSRASGMWILALSTVGLLIAFAAAACGSGSGDATAVAASATAERREQAIATFTAEALAAVPTATPFPIATPTLDAARNEPTQTRATATPTPRSDGENPDRIALKDLLHVRARAMTTGDIGAWYETCLPGVRQHARDGKALEKQLALMRLDPDDLPRFEFILEEVFFTGGTSATVVWGFKTQLNYFPGAGGGPYLKEEGKWYSIGWGCAA